MSNYFNGEPLFFEPAPIEKLARTKLGDDPKQWESDILDVLHQQHPYLLDSRISIKMKKVDAESGSGIGSIVMDDKVNVPLVIHNYRLAPLDVFLNGDEIVPLTRERIEQTLKTLAIGKPVAPSKGESSDSAISGMTQPPHDGKYTFANTLDYTEGEFADAISRSFSESGFVVGMTSNQLWKDSLSEYLRSAGSSVKVASTASLTLDDAPKQTYTTVSEPGIYSVPTTKGDKTGVLVPVTEKLASSSDRWIFVSITDGSYATIMNPTTAEIPHKEASVVKIANHNVEDHKSGIFVANTNNKLQATDIFDVIAKVGSDTLLRDRVGRQYKMVKTAEVDHIEISKGFALIPETAVFIPTTDPVSITMLKTANRITEGPDTITVSNRQSRIHFNSFKDWDFLDILSKEGTYVSDVRELLTPVFDDQALNKLAAIKEGETVKFNVRQLRAETPEVVADVDVPSLSSDDLVAINKTAAMITADAVSFIKLSAESSKDTVDALLGLNFLTKQNLNKFIDNMDKIGEARQVVGQLLIASRLGLDVDDSPLREAFFALDSVEQDLQQLYNVTTASK